MNKSEFIIELCDRCKLPKTQAKNLYEEFLDILKDKLCKGEEVVFQGFGKFTLVQSKARKGYSVKSKKIINIAPVNRVKFTTALSFKHVIN